MSILSAIKESMPGNQEQEKAEDVEEEKEFEFDISDDKDVKITTEHDKLADVDVKYPLIKPFAYAHIYWEEEEKNLIYHVEEPNLSEEERKQLDTLKTNLSDKLNVSLSSLQNRNKTIDFLEGKLKELIKELGMDISDEQKNKLMYYIYRDFVGLGKLEPFMHDPYIEDLGCDGIGIPVFAAHNEFGSLKSNVKWEEKENLKNLVSKLAERAGQYVSYADPLLNGALPDGSRVNATLTEDVTSKGPTFSIRKFQDEPFSAVDMIDLGTASPNVLAFMWLMLEYQRSLMIVGGTSTGKTSFLNANVSFIPPEYKIVSIEDTRELRLPHENWIPSVSRSMFGDSGGADVSMEDLLEESFRQNPDYVVVGEVRGDEASVLFQGMASGHPAIGTMHASSPNDVVKRLVTPPISLSPALVESLDLIVVMTHARGLEEGARRVRTIEEIQKVIGDSNSARSNTAFSWTARDDSHVQRGEPYLFDEISKNYGVGKKELKNELNKRKEVLEWLQDKGVKDFETVSEIIAEYYNNQEKIMNIVRSESGEKKLQDVIEAHEEVDIGRDDAEGMKLEQEVAKADLDGSDTLEEKLQSEGNPVAKLESKLKDEKLKHKTEERNNPFGSSEKKTQENPFQE